MFKRFLILISCVAMNCLVLPASAITDEQKNSIVDNCVRISDNLKNIQKSDAKARIFLGSHYETVLSKYVMPLNIKMVEKNKSDTGLIGNQNEIAEARVSFSNHFVDYQKGLEELVAMNCKVEPEKYYEKLVSVRDKRKTVASDVQKIDKLMKKNLDLVKKLKENL